MSNFGSIQVKFFHPETLAARITNPLLAISASGVTRLSRIGGGKITINADQLGSLPVGYPEILPDDIAVAWIQESTPSTANRSICTFKIKNINKATGARGISTISLSGPDLLSELNDFLHFFAIGAPFETTLNNTGLAGTTTIAVTSMGYLESALQQTAHIGETEIQVALADLNTFADGDEIMIPLDDGSLGDDSHRTKITNVALSEDELYTTLTIEDPMPGEADGGNIVYVPIAQKGDTIKIKRNGGAWFYAHIINDPAKNKIEIYPAYAETINAGNDVEIISGIEPLTTGDITAIMAPAVAAGWSLTGTTSTGGSAHNPTGAKISDLLMKTAEKTGDYFYIKQTDATAPSRLLEWKADPVASGVTLLLPTQATAAANFQLTTSGLLDSFEDLGEANLVSRITGTVTDETVHLGLATTIDANYPRSYENGAWVIKNKALDADLDGIYRVHRFINFSDIEPISSSEAARADTAQALYDACVEYLQKNTGSNHYYKAGTVIHGNILPGRSLTVTYAEAEWSINTTLYVSEESISVSSTKGGIRRHELILSNTSPRELFTQSQKLMKATAIGSATTTTSGGGGTGGGIGITDHGQLTGLIGTDHHTQYALLAGRLGDILKIEQVEARSSAGLKLYDDGGNGLFIQDGGNVGIGTGSPTGKLHILGTVAATVQEIIQAHGSQSVDISRWLDSAGNILAKVDKRGIPNFYAGTNVLNCFIGDNAGSITTTGTKLFALGANSLAGVTSGTDHTAVGNNALQRIQVGDRSLGLGSGAARFNTGTQNTAVGGNALYGVDGVSTGEKNTALGTYAGYAITTGVKNILLGTLAGAALTSGSSNVFVGYRAGAQETGSNKLYIHNENVTDPLIYGEFDNRIITLNSDVTIDGNLAAGSATGLTQAAIKATATNANDYALYLIQRADQAASMVRFEDSGGSALLLLTKDGDLESGQPGFVSGLTGWQITHLGDAEFNNLVARGEFHASVFVADEMHAAGGTLAIMSMGILHSNATLPATINSTFTLSIKASIDTGLCPFAVDDIVRMKYMVHDGTSLDIWDVYAEVDAQGTLTGRDLTESEPGYYPMTCRWRLGGKAALTIPALTAAVKWGEVAGTAGTYTGGLILTSDLSQAPYIDVFTLPADHVWAGVAPIPTPRVRVGNLDGVLGLSEQWGIALGKDLSDTTLDAPYIVASDLQLKLNNVAISIFDSSNNQRVSIEPDGDIFAGTDITSTTTTTFYHAGATGVVRLGPTGAVGKGNIYWDGSDLRIRNNTTTVIKLGSDGNSYFAGVMLIDTAGYIRQGTGTWGSTFSGIAIFNDSGIGTFAAYNAGNKVSWLDDQGITIESPNSGSHFSYRAYNFENAAGTDLGGLYSRHSTAGGSQNMYIQTNPTTGYSSVLGLYSYAGSNDDADVFLLAQGNNLTSTAVYIQIQSNNGNTGNSITATGAPFLIADGLVVGETDPAESLGVGSIVLDQGALDTAIFVCKSSDMSEADQGMVDANTYFQIQKYDAATGGAYLMGASESYAAMTVRGSSALADTSEAITSLAPVVLRGYIDTDPGLSDVNLVVMRSANDAKWILKHNGMVYSDYSTAMTTYDDHDDLALISAVANRLGGNILQSAWDDFIKYNADDLARLKIVTPTGFVNEQNLNKLFIGAFRQMRDRIAQLEERINGDSRRSI